MPKRKNAVKELKTEKLTIRVSPYQKGVLERRAAKHKSTVSGIVLHQLKPLLTVTKRKPETPYSCYKCGRTLRAGEDYYCELANIERFVESEARPLELEIEVKDSQPLKILCMDCAKRARKLAQFREKEEDPSRVKSSERELA